jgi:hypothetical protein
MIPTALKSAAITAFVPILLVAARPAYAQAQAQQPAASSSPWSFDVGIGWDDVISGNINSSGIGQINNQAVVITSNSFEDVYGTGLHLRFGGGYALSDVTEVTATFVFQSSEADQVTPMGDIGVSNLYGKYTDYQTFGLDMGLRRYMNLSSSLRLYGEGAVGVGFIDETDVTLVAPSANLSGDANDFYDQTAALGLGASFGVLYQTGGRTGFYGELGLRWMSGMAEIDDLAGTGLEDINNKSSRWTLPLTGGVRFRF